MSVILAGFGSFWLVPRFSKYANSQGRYFTSFVIKRAGKGIFVQRYRDFPFFVFRV